MTDIKSKWDSHKKDDKYKIKHCANIYLQESKIIKRWHKAKATMLQSGWFSLILGWYSCIKYSRLVFSYQVFLVGFLLSSILGWYVSIRLVFPYQVFLVAILPSLKLKGLSPWFSLTRTTTTIMVIDHWIYVDILKNHWNFLIQTCWLEQRQQVHEKSGKSTKIEEKLENLQKILRKIFWRSWEKKHAFCAGLKFVIFLHKRNLRCGFV